MGFLVQFALLLGLLRAQPREFTLTAVTAPVKEAPAMVRLSIANNSKESIEIWETTPALDFQFEVTNANGRPVERTPLGKLDPRDWILSRRRLQIASGETQEWRVSIEALFKLVPGQAYNLTVSRTIARQAITGKWESLKLTTHLNLELATR